HRGRLIDREHDVPFMSPPLIGEEVKALGDEALLQAIPALEVRTDRAPPVDVARELDRARPIAADRAEDRGADVRLEPAPKLLDDLADDPPCDLLRLVGDQRGRADQGGGELDVLLEERERLGLEEELGEAAALDRVLLDERDHVLAEELAQAPQPL